MKFGSKWLKWIKARACYFSFSVLINGSPAIDFQARRGLLQGDPLSHVLFILAAEGIADLLQNTRSSHCYRPFSLNNNIHVDHLQFADETTIV